MFTSIGTLTHVIIPYLFITLYAPCIHVKYAVFSHDFPFFSKDLTLHFQISIIHASDFVGVNLILWVSIYNYIYAVDSFWCVLFGKMWENRPFFRTDMELIRGLVGLLSCHELHIRM